MTKAQKKIFKRLKGDAQREGFLTMLQHQQNALGRFAHWAPAYQKKLRKKGLPEALPPI